MAKYLPIFTIILLSSPMALAGSVIPSSIYTPSSSTSDQEQEDDEEGEPDKKRRKRQSKTKQYYDRDMAVFQRVAEMLGELNGETPEGRRIRHEVGVRADELDTIVSALQKIRRIATIATLLPEFRALLEQNRQGPRDIAGTLVAIQEIVRRGVVAGTLEVDLNQQELMVPEEIEPVQPMQEEEQRFEFPPEDLDAAQQGLANLPPPAADPFEDFDFGQLQDWPPQAHVGFNFPPLGGSGAW